MAQDFANGRQRRPPLPELHLQAAFMSGPIRSVDSALMTALRWVENIRETLDANGIYR
jgi:hypothetical protein